MGRRLHDLNRIGRINRTHVPERQTGASVISLFRVVARPLRLAPIGKRQLADTSFDIGNIRPLPYAVQVRLSPGSLRRGALRRLIPAAFGRALLLRAYKT